MQLHEETTIDLCMYSYVAIYLKQHGQNDGKLSRGNNDNTEMLCTRNSDAVIQQMR